MSRIENWIKSKLDPKPDELDFCLMGEVWDDERYDSESGNFANGHMIRTTRVIEINEEEGWARTRNTLYTLGKEYKY